jgi:hypothetical protein
VCVCVCVCDCAEQPFHMVVGGVVVWQITGQA